VVHVARRRNARWRCSASRRWHGAGAWEAAEEQRLTGAGTVNGGAASMGEASVGMAVGSAKRSGRRRGRRGGWETGSTGEATVGHSVTRSEGGRRGRGDCRGDGGVGEAVGRWAGVARRALSATAAARRAGRAVDGHEVCCRDARRAVPTAP
jgi:hypothetical protein